MMAYMLVDCPKCGFNQPKDRYCARCGVDMETFTPKQPPIWARLSDRPAFHVGMAIVLVGLLFSWIYFSQKQDIDAKIRQAFTAQESPTATAVTQPTEAPAAPQAANRAMRLASQLETQPAPEPTAADDTLEENSETAVAKMPSVLRITYLEVPRPLIRLWAEEGQVLNETANTRSILLPGSQAPTDYGREEWSLFKLPGGKATRLQPNQIIRENHFRRGGTESAEIGFALEIIPDDISSTGVQFDSQMVVSLPSPLDGDITTTTTTGRFEIPPGSTLVILGGLPQQSVRGEAAKVFMDTPLQVLQSPEYLSGTSEFAIFIQAQ